MTDYGTFDDELVNAWLACVGDNAWVSLHYESPALMGIGRGEIFGGGYVRQKVTFSTPVSRAIWSLTDAKFVGLPANRLTHFGVWNAKGSGSIKAYGPLPTDKPRIITSGGGYVIYAGTLALSLQ